MRKRSPTFTFALPLVIALLAVLGGWLQQGTKPTSMAGLDADEQRNVESTEHSSVVHWKTAVATLSRQDWNTRDQLFREWISDWKAIHSAEQKQSLREQGIVLAAARREALWAMMKSDPEAALAASLRWDEWISLPPEVRNVSETPISKWVRQDSMVLCDPMGGRSSHELWLAEGRQKEWRAFSFGRRSMPMTRAGVPVQGFVIGKEAVARPDAAHVLIGAEAEAVRSIFPDVDFPKGVSAWSGDPLDIDSSTALLIGGHVATVNAAEVESLLNRLHHYEDQPGETGGVDELRTWLASGQAVDGQTVTLNEALPPPPPSGWSETPKSLLFIRVDFPDLVGAREEYQVVYDKLVNEVSPLISEMSYGKTHLNVTVTPEVIRLPQSSNYYPAEQEAGNNGNGQLHDDAQAGAEALGYVMEDYDLISVQFRGIGMGGGGLAVYGGLASGKRTWMQSGGKSLFTHEYGHNYGLGHASRWHTVPPADPFASGDFDRAYGGAYNFMGSSRFPDGHFDSHHKIRLNWLEAHQMHSVNSSGTYRLYRSDHSGVPGAGGAAAMRVARPSGGDFLWIDYKRNFTDKRRLSRGVQVLWEKNGSPNRNWRVRAGRAGSFPDNDFELPVGQTFSDRFFGQGIHITPVGRGGTPPAYWIDVEVQINPPAGNQNPIASWGAPPPATLRPRDAASFRVSASDPDGNPIAYHWDMGDGSEVSVNAPEIHHVYSESGLYDVSVVVSDMRGGTTTLATTVQVGFDPTGWTLQSSGTTDQSRDVAASETRAVITSTTGKVFHSANGASWSSVDLRVQEGLNRLFLGEVLWNGAAFISAGQQRETSGSSEVGCIYRSVDGINWSRVHVGGPTLQRVAFANGVWLVGGSDGRLLQSSDGMAWTSVTFPLMDDVRGIAFGEDVWHVVTDENNAAARAFTTADLVTWTERTWPQHLANNDYVDMLEFMGGRFYCSGFGVGITSIADLDGLPVQEWNEGVTVIEHIGSVNGQLFFCGITYDLPARDGVIYTKVPGTSWVQVPLTPPGDVKLGITGFLNRAIAVGGGGEIWMSDEILNAPTYSWWNWKEQNTLVLGADDDLLGHPFGTALPNFYHYAVGNPPGGGLVPRLPFPGRDGSGNLVLRIPRDGIRPDVTYRVLRSTNLVNWTDSGITILRNDADMLEACGSGPGPDGNEFLRFEADLSP